MSRQAIDRDPESVRDVLWGSVWAGLGCVFVETVLVGTGYVFVPEVRPIIEGHAFYLLLGALALFVVGFGASLQSILEMQFFRGKWK